RRMRARTRRVLRPARPVALGQRPGESWRHGRFAGPRQRDALLDVGVCVETLETAGYWSALGPLRDRVRAALSETLPGAIVMCHVSHAYETGASLYFTVLAARDENAISQWHRAKDAASRAIGVDPAGTITHHHAVGVDHQPYLAAEIGEVGADVLAAIKQAVDPAGIMNPGKLIPADGDAE
ncbi:MAG TPA: FAD-linked oxidase C-terminal domain-containing protein, partial [Pseudonocardiaceae bacterium]|nr:FAD-linked oxidase C-terminal domain-containing protein [Pseudonocardiaceae bacterium]